MLKTCLNQTTYTFSIWFVLDEWCHATQSTESQDSSEDCNGTEAEGIPGTTSRTNRLKQPVPYGQGIFLYLNS